MGLEKMQEKQEDSLPIQQQERKEKSFSFGLWAGGIAFTFLIAFLGFLLANIPGFRLVGQMASAIMIAIVFRQIFGYPEVLRPGVTFSSKVLLRTAIVLYGLKLNIHTVLQDGLGLLIRDAGIIAVAILATVWIAKRLRANPVISLLLGVGTGVCGAAAIAAVAPIVKAKDEDTAISVGIIALVGTVFGIVYTILRPILPFTGAEYGAWTGMSLHEIAHVVLAGAPGGQEALGMALLAKLGRVFLLVPLCFVLVYWMKSKAGKESTGNAKVGFPLFLIGFIAMSLIGTYVLGSVVVVPQSVMDFVSGGTTWLLTAAMVGLGLNVSLQDVRAKALKPLAAMFVASVLVSVLAFFLV